MASIGRACARCYRLKVRCKPLEDGDSCERCISSNAKCVPRTATFPATNENERPEVKRLADRIQQLSESVAALQERGDVNSRIWGELTEETKIDLFETYRTVLAPGYPLVHRDDLIHTWAVQACRPHFFRAACCSAMAHQDVALGLALLKENYKHLCEVHMSDEPPSLDLIHALYISTLYLPHPDKDIFKVMLGASNMAYQTLQMLTNMGHPFEFSSNVVEFERCRVAVYFLCNSSRLWQRDDLRLITWNKKYEQAAIILNAGDKDDQAFISSVQYMKIAEGISFLSTPELSTEDIFRHYLKIFAADPNLALTPNPAFPEIMIPLVKLLNCVGFIDSYLELIKDGDMSVNIPLAFDAIMNEGMGALLYAKLLRESPYRFPGFFYIRVIRTALTIAFFCRTWCHTYFEDFYLELCPIYDDIVAKFTFLIFTRSMLDMVNEWYQSYDATAARQDTLAEVIDRVFKGASIGQPIRTPT